MRLRGQLITLDRTYPLVRVDGVDLRAEYASSFTRQGAKATVGDWLEMEQDGPGDVLRIASIEERRTLLLRRQCIGHPSLGPGAMDEQLLAANFDMVFVVAGLGRARLDLSYLERQLVAASESGTKVTVLLNKADLAGAGLAGMVSAAREAAYGCEVLACSATGGQGLGELARLCPEGSMSVFLGRSGVGKSSLINALTGEESLATGPTREADQAGRHTTVARRMVFSRGRAYFDTPGLRSIGVYQMEDGLDAAFADVLGLAGQCRFRDCRHQSEPGCAVQAAILSGGLTGRRLKSYLSLAAEVAGDDMLGDG